MGLHGRHSASQQSFESCIIVLCVATATLVPSRYVGLLTSLCPTERRAHLLNPLGTIPTGAKLTRVDAEPQATTWPKAPCGSWFCRQRQLSQDGCYGYYRQFPDSNIGISAIMMEGHINAKGGISSELVTDPGWKSERSIDE